MVYWADLLYAAPLSPGATLEAASAKLITEEVPDIGLRWVVDADAERAEFIGQLASSIGFEELASNAPELAAPVEPSPSAVPVAATLELVPLPWFIKRPLMKIFLRDVHHYLFDVEYTPRPGYTHHVRTEIRRRALEKLTAGAQTDGKHIIVSHSLGTVIAYDCLKRVADCPAVDGLMTIGSPLGLSEVQDKLKPEWSKQDGFPAKDKGDWVNVFDHLDPVAGADPKLADEYERGGVKTIEDISEPNEGAWRHSIVKYLRGPKLREHLQAMLEL